MNATDDNAVQLDGLRPATFGGPNRASRWSKRDIARLTALESDGMPAGFVLFDVPSNRSCTGVGILPDGRSVGRMLAVPEGLKERAAWDNTITVLCVAEFDGSIQVLGKCNH